MVVIAIGSRRNDECIRVFRESFHDNSCFPGWFPSWSFSAIDIVAAFSHGDESPA
jgi:hypothetical protein